MHKRCDKISDLDYDKYSRVPKNEATYVCLSCKRISRDNYLDQLPFAEVSFTEHSPEEPNTSNLDIGIKEHLTGTDIWANFMQRGLHFLHLNRNSLLPKIDELRLIANKANAAVIGTKVVSLKNHVSYVHRLSLPCQKMEKERQTKVMPEDVVQFELALSFRQTVKMLTYLVDAKRFKITQ